MAKKKYTILITWASYEDFEAESAEEAAEIAENWAYEIKGEELECKIAGSNVYTTIIGEANDEIEETEDEEC